VVARAGGRAVAGSNPVSPIVGKVVYRRRHDRGAAAQDTAHLCEPVTAPRLTCSWRGRGKASIGGDACIGVSVVLHMDAIDVLATRPGRGRGQAGHRRPQSRRMRVWAGGQARPLALVRLRACLRRCRVASGPSRRAADRHGRSGAGDDLVERRCGRIARVSRSGLRVVSATGVPTRARDMRIACGVSASGQPRCRPRAWR
jgi:hypothetical protein